MTTTGVWFLNQATTRGPVPVVVVLMQVIMTLVVQPDWVGWTILMKFLLVLLSIPITAGMQTPVMCQLQTKQPWGGGSLPLVGTAANMGLKQKGMVQTPVLHELQNKHPWGGGIIPLVRSAVNVGLEQPCTMQPWGRGINPLVGPEQSWSASSSRQIIPISKVRIPNPLMGHFNIHCVTNSSCRIWW